MSAAAPPPARRWRRIMAWVLGVAVLVPVSVVALALIVFNTAPGQRRLSGLIGRFSGGAVRIAGLHGAFPDRLRMKSLAVADAQGVWLRADQVVLDWSAWSLLGGTLHVRLLRAADIAVLRRPVPAPPRKKPSPHGGASLPVAVDIDRIDLPAIDVSATVSGMPARLEAQGSAHLRSLTRGRLALTVDRVGAAGGLTASADLTDRTIAARVALRDPANGLVGGLVHLPGITPLSATLAIDGKWTAAAETLALDAGGLSVRSTGTVDLRGEAADLTLTAAAPARQLAPGFGWRSLAINGRIHGRVMAPVADLTASIDDLSVNGTRVGAIRLEGTADRTVARLAGTLGGIVLPPPSAALLAGAPVSVQASMRLNDPARPVTFRFTHPVLTGQGSGILAPRPKMQMVLAAPDLGAIAATLHKTVQGSAGMTIDVAQTAAGATAVDLHGRVDVTGGASVPPAARGETSLDASALLHGGDVTLDTVALDGNALHLTASGAYRGGIVSARWLLALPRLGDLSPRVTGALGIDGSAQGTLTDLAADMSVDGTLGTGGVAPAPVSFQLAATGLPNAPAGTLDGSATLAGAALTLDLGARRANGASTIDIRTARWKSLDVAGTLSLRPGASLPQGRLSVDLGRLQDLDALLGMHLAGSVRAAVDLPPDGTGHVTASARALGIAGKAMVDALALDTTLRGQGAGRSVTGTLTASGIEAGHVRGSARIAASGPLSALALQVSATASGLAGADATLRAAATIDQPGHQVRLTRLDALWRTETLSLGGPALVTYAPGVSVDRLALRAAAPGAAPATLNVSGKLSPGLAITADLRGLTPALARPFMPTLRASGVLTATARIGGSAARPTGIVRISATGLRALGGQAAALPAADLTARIDLEGSSAQLDATAAAGGGTRFTVAGAVPIAGGGPIGLRASGRLDLALLNPILNARGITLQGKTALDATIGGTAQAPSVMGALTLTGGGVQDYAVGAHLTQVAARIAADGRTIRIAQFTGDAGGGTVTAAGTVSLAGDEPVDLTLTASHARPIDSDLVSAMLDASLTVTGTVRTSVAVGGTIHVLRADIQVPDRMPASVQTLNVRLAGQKPPPPAPPGPDIPLTITLNAPAQIFVRGRGLDAELGGSLRIGGTVSAPLVQGGIDLRHGNYSLAGTTLTFTSGQITFNGSRRLDPALDLVASSETTNLTATLTVGGYASNPTITLSSVPQMPQDQILAALLFGQSVASLSPFQIAEIGAALAQLTGVGGGGPNPLDTVRKGLGLDQLTVGSISNQNANGGASNTTTALEGGKYIAPGVFLGAKQGVTGQATQAQLQIDLTKRLKLNTDVGSGPGSNDIGLSYQFQY